MDKSSMESKKMTEITGFVIETTAKKMKQVFKKMLLDQKVGITVDQWVILQALSKTDGISQLKIAKNTFKDAPTVTRIIDLLCEKDLAQRTMDTQDRRKFNIFITKAGEEKVKYLEPFVKDFRKRSLNNITVKDMENMMRILNTISENLTD